MTQIQQKGTYEWAQETLNFLDGCANNCVACWWGLRCAELKKCPREHFNIARVNMAKANTKLRQITRKVARGEVQTVMIPSTHDVPPEHAGLLLIYVQALLEIGVHVLWVTKPRLDVVDPVLARLDKIPGAREMVEIRCTIGSQDSDLLREMEPGASSFGERVHCLWQAFDAGYKTSVSIEPYYYAQEVPDLVQTLAPHVRGEIWIGAMNYRDRLQRMWRKLNHPEIAGAIAALAPEYSRESMEWLYWELVDHPKVTIRWKDSFQKMLGITATGLFLTAPAAMSSLIRGAK